jgi:L-gulonate 3-dehydrogenase
MAFALGGAHVRLFDVSRKALAAAIDSIHAAAEDLTAAGRVESREALLARIRPAGCLAEAIEGASHVQESVIDDLEIKKRVFAELDAMAPRSVTLGSSSGEIMVSKFTTGLPGAGRCLLVHPVNPPHVLRAVEICPTPWTERWAVDVCTDLIESIGMVPISLSKEISGYVINRLQYALINEALHLVGEGYCEPKDVDAAIKHGLGLRWAFLGPFETSHLNATHGYFEYMTTDESGTRRLMSDIRAGYPWDHALALRIHQYLEKKMPAQDMARHQRDRDRTLLQVMNLLSGHS